MGEVARALVFCLVAALGLDVAVLIVPAIRSTARHLIEPDAEYEVGEKIDILPSVYQTRRQTVIFFGRSTCGACRGAAAFLAKLSLRIAEQKAARFVYVTTGEHWAGELAFGRDIGVPAVDVIQVKARSLKLKTVPLLIVVDQAGRVTSLVRRLPDASSNDDAVSAAIDEIARTLR